MGRRLLVLALVTGACNAELMDPRDTPVDAQPTGDGSATDGPDGGGTMLGPWGTPTMIPGANTAAGEDDATMSPTGLEIIFAISDAADQGRKDLYVMTRTSTSGAFSTPTKLAFSVTGSSEETPRLTTNGKTLYFASDRAGGAGGLDIYMATRANPAAPWSAPALVPGPNTTASEKWFMPCGSGNDYLLVAGPDLAMGTINGAAPTVVAELSSASPETGTFLTSDCLTSYFASSRSGAFQIYTSHRTSTSTAWQTPTVVTDFASVGGAQEDPWISADGRTFLFVSNVSGSKDVYISTR